MLKKFIGYTIIYCILHSNMVYAGNGGLGGEQKPQSRSLHVQQNSPQDFTETTPLNPKLPKLPTGPNAFNQSLTNLAGATRLIDDELKNQEQRKDNGVDSARLLTATSSSPETATSSSSENLLSKSPDESVSPLAQVSTEDHDKIPKLVDVDFEQVARRSPPLPFVEQDAESGHAQGASSKNGEENSDADIVIHNHTLPENIHNHTLPENIQHVDNETPFAQTPPLKPEQADKDFQILSIPLQATLLTFIPDWCVTKIPDLALAIDESPSSLIKSIQEDDSGAQEKQKTATLSEKLQQLLNKLSPKGRASLKNQVKLWEQALAMLFGAGVGGVSAYALSKLYNVAIFNLILQFDNKLGVLLDGQGLFYYIFITSLFDAVPRNALYGKKALAYLSRPHANMKEVLFLGGIACLPSFITPFAFISSSFEIIDFFYKFGSIQEYIRVYKDVINQIKTYPIPLYLNDWAFNINMAAEMRKDLQDWAETSNFFLARLLHGEVFYSLPLPQEVLRRRNFNKKFNLVIETFPHMSDNTQQEIYEQIRGANQAIAALQDIEDPEALKNFLAYFYILSLGDELEQMEKQSHQSHNSDEFLISKDDALPQALCELDADVPLPPTSISNDEDEDQEGCCSHPFNVYENVADALTWGSLLVGSPVRLMVLKFVVEDILRAIIYANSNAQVSPEVTIAAWMIATIIGFPVQTGFEYKGMKNFFKMLWNEEYEGHENCLWTRRFIKLCSLGQGLILTVPIGILALQALTEQFGKHWLTDPELAAYKWGFFPSLLCYLFPEWAVQTSLVGDAFDHDLLTGGTDLYYAYIQPPLGLKAPNQEYQQDWTLRYMKEKQEHMTYLPDGILLEWENLLNAKRNNQR